MGRVRTNIEIEDSYVRTIIERYGLRTKTEAVDLALRHLVGQPMTREEALAMRGGTGNRQDAIRYRPGPMILADTSAWVEYDRATGSEVDERMTELIAGDGELAVTEPVVMEVMAGARTDDREQDLRRLLLRYQVLTFDPAADFDGAARIYRRCRQVGVTPRGLIDCMIASVARRHQVHLLAHDADISRVANVVGIELDAASLTA